ncbi:Uncharacterised protein [Chlamydia trachomatis]|nr:Uncharacterised protein [Chlamydia trachomatis]
MLQHPYLFNEYRVREDFEFYTPELQVLYDLLKNAGEISSFDLVQQSDAVQTAWYRILEEKLPSEVGNQEMDDLELARDREWLKRDNRQRSRFIREQSHVGNDDAALDELAQLIAQKRKME